MLASKSYTPHLLASHSSTLDTTSSSPIPPLTWAFPSSVKGTYKEECAPLSLSATCEPLRFLEPLGLEPLRVHGSTREAAQKGKTRAGSVGDPQASASPLIICCLSIPVRLFLLSMILAMSLLGLCLPAGTQCRLGYKARWSSGLEKQLQLMLSGHELYGTELANSTLTDCSVFLNLRAFHVPVQHHTCNVCIAPPLST